MDDKGEKALTIADYILAHTDRGECQCGKCCDSQGDRQPEGHTVDMVFFKVAPKDSPTKDEFLRLTHAHPGEWGDVDPLDGNEHSYLELGGWIGDQGLAMQYMALGVSLGIFRLFSPAMLRVTGEMAMQMAGNGFLSIQAKH